MNENLQQILGMMRMVGIDPVRSIKLVKNLSWYYRNYYELKKQAETSAEHFCFGKLFPCLDERHSQGGSARGHYFHQDLLVARRIFENRPLTHVDVASRVDGFVAHVASFRNLKVFDIRPITSHVNNIEFVAADLMSESDIKKYVESCESLSCLHALEHFGLGRYGDPIQWDGHLIGLNSLFRLLKPHGKLYLSVPIGPQRIEFNAHRVFNIQYLLDKFDGRFSIDHFSYVDDSGDLHEDVKIDDVDVRNNFGCNYGCGIFELTKY